jgi:hypothetical protein
MALHRDHPRRMGTGNRRMKQINRTNRPLLAGQEVYRWTLLSKTLPLTSKTGRQRSRWLCRCKCGTEKMVLDQSLRRALLSQTGGSRSCGCLVTERSTKHGSNSAGGPTSEYTAWIGAKKRCYSPGNPSYKHYGQRGIKMCSEWASSFEVFLRDMGPKPYPDYSLDRIDPEGNYEPGNCRWASSSVQARNKRNTRWYEFEGQPALLIDIARFLGISRDQARAHLRRGHLPVRILVEAPVVPDSVVSLFLDLNTAKPITEAPNSLETGLD